MENQIPADSFSLEEVQAAFGRTYAVIVGQLTLNNLSLEKQMQALRLNLDGAMKTIDDLSHENSKLITNHIQLEGLMHGLERELEDRPTLGQMRELEAKIKRLIKAGPTLAQSAALELATTEAGIKEAVPEDG